VGGQGQDLMDTVCVGGQGQETLFGLFFPSQSKANHHGG